MTSLEQWCWVEWFHVISLKPETKSKISLKTQHKLRRIVFRSTCWSVFNLVEVIQSQTKGYSIYLTLILASVSTHTSSGQPKTEKGNRAEENHVSNTSSSCRSEILSLETPKRWAAFSFAFSSLGPLNNQSYKTIVALITKFSIISKCFLHLCIRSYLTQYLSFKSYNTRWGFSLIYYYYGNYQNSATSYSYRVQRHLRAFNNDVICRNTMPPPQLTWNTPISKDKIEKISFDTISYLPSSHVPVIRMFHCLFIVLKISLFSMSSSHNPVIRMFHCLFIVLKIPLFSMSSSHDSVIRMFHCLFIVFKISLFSMPSSHNPVIRMFHWLFIVLKIPLFSMSSSHDSVIRMFNCLFIVLKIPLFSMPSSYSLF
jgi:hypothetical protein